MSAGYTKLCERFTERLFLVGLEEESVPLNVALVVPIEVARIPETVPVNVAEYSPGASELSLLRSKTKLNE